MTENEQAATDLGNHKIELFKRLIACKHVLTARLGQLFSYNTYDFENKRLISNDRRYWLQWRLRMHPDQPEDYKNQQTRSGCVLFMQAPEEQS